MRSIYAVPIVALVGTGVASRSCCVAGVAAAAAAVETAGRRSMRRVAGDSEKRDAYDDRIDAELRDLDG